MISHFDAAMSLSIGIRRLQAYGSGDEETMAGTFCRTDTPPIVLVYVQGGVAPLGLKPGEYGEVTTRALDAFVWRWMPLWLHRNVALVVVDFPRKYATQMPPSERVSPHRIETLLNIVEATRNAYPRARVMGYGHSYGSLEMSELAKVSDLEKIIIGSGCWKAGPEAENYRDVYVKALEPSEVKMPLLVVQHQNDLTSKCSYAEASKAMLRFSGLTVSGGMPHLGAYGEEPGPHFFLSQENEVVKGILDWVRDGYRHRSID